MKIILNLLKQVYCVRNIINYQLYKRFNTSCLFKLALTQKYRQYRKKRKQTQWWSGARRICVLEMQGPQNISIGY